VALLIGLAFANMDAQAFVAFLEVAYVKPDELGATEGAGKAEQEHGQIAKAVVRFTSCRFGFETLPGSNFTVNGAAPPKDSALTTLAAELRLTANCSLTGKFDGEFRCGSEAYGGTGTLHYSW
jgi:hypothetical protein